MNALFPFNVRSPPDQQRDGNEFFDNSLRERLLGDDHEPQPKGRVPEEKTAVEQKEVDRWKTSNLSKAEENKVVNEWNETDESWPEHACIHELFEQQASSHPDRVALIYEDRSWTYREVQKWVTSAALVLRGLGVKRDIPVALLLDRSVETVISIYAVLKAGGFYVPLDIGWPESRLRDILQDADPPLLVTIDELRATVPLQYKGKIICIDKINVTDEPTTGGGAIRHAEEAFESPGSSAAVYCFYTSGSTGKPKGVIVEHRGLVKRIHWFMTRYPLKQPGGRVLNKTPYVFGISEWEYFWALQSGGTLVIAGPEQHKDPDALAKLIKCHEVTACFFVPTMLSLFLENLNDGEVLPLTHVFACGEALTPNVCNRFSQKLHAKLINLYGPTEADITFWECPRDEQVTHVPIGKPISNVKVYILDNELKPVPVGAPGELHFGGYAIARGYLNRPGLTAQKFIPNPFHSGMLYKTGDIAAWMVDGNIEYRGRVDSQIKLRGFRIELGEVERVLLGHSFVRETVVQVEGNDPSNHHLVANVVPKLEMDQVVTLKLACQKTLPCYMVPEQINTMDKFPLTDRQKVCRRSLSNMYAQQRRHGLNQGQIDLCQGQIEERIESIWKEVLDVDSPIDRNAEFTKLGGTSILAGYAISKIRKEFEVSLPGTLIYTHPTVAALAKSLRECQEGQCLKNGPAKAIIHRERKGWRGHHATPSIVAVQLFCLVLKQIFSHDVISGISLFVTFFWTQGRGFLAIVVFCPAVLFLEIILTCAVAVCLKSLLVGRLIPGKYPVYGSYYTRWWVVSGVVNNATELLATYFAGTVVFNAWYRLLGAKVGRHTIINCPIPDADLFQIGDEVEIAESSELIATSVESGELVIAPSILGNKVQVKERAVVPKGITLATGTIVGPKATAISTHQSGKRTRASQYHFMRCQMSQQLLRTLAGFPFLLLAESLPIMVEVLLFDSMYPFLLGDFGIGGIVVFVFVAPKILFYIGGEVCFWEVMVVKWVLFGRFKAGKHMKSTWDLFRRWLLQRLTNRPGFESSMLPWVNSEFLSMKYRMLGASIGQRVNMDFIRIDEFDLLTVGSNVIFGTGNQLNANDDDESSPIVIEDSANVLDHCYFMPGVTVEKEALCGSGTLGAKGHTFPAYSISTGSRDGKSILLRQRSCGAEEDVTGLPKEERELIAISRRRHHSTCVWLGFNLWVLLNAILFEPSETFLLFIMITLWHYIPISSVVFWILSPFAYCLLQFTHLLIMCGVKWLLMGRVQGGNHAFYGCMHLRWVANLNLLTSTVGEFRTSLEGTVFLVWFERLLGATIGSNVYMKSAGNDHDLMSIGDEACLNSGNSAHTVENFVLKFAPVKIGNRCIVLQNSELMPGGSMEDDSMLLELSVVLNGETVTEGTVWSGLPAEQRGRIDFTEEKLEEPV